MSVIDQDSMNAESKDANLNELNFDTQERTRKSTKRNIQRSVDMKFQNVTQGDSLLFEDNSPLLLGTQN